MSRFLTTTNKELLAALRESFPQLFSSRTEDGETLERLDLEKIRLLAGEGNYSDRYGLRWENKPERFDAESVGKLPSLKHVVRKSIQVDPAKPSHVLIQGDNYHALKVLAYTHERSVDVIYIDPPYNTGNKDFKYNDRFVDREDGYRHSKWLSFMAKRLRLAKSLLKDSGALFISIDEAEFAQLKLLSCEVFGEENYIGTFAWRKKVGGGQAKYFYECHEHVLVIAKNKRCLPALTAKKEVKPTETVIIEGVPYYRYRGWLRKEHGRKTTDEHFVLFYEEIEQYKGREKLAEIDAEISAGRMRLEYDKRHGMHEVVKLEPLAGLRKKLSSLITSCLTSDGNDELLELSLSFPNPKPLQLVRELIDSVSSRHAVVLDFFAGSGTTAHAVMQLNAEDGGSRQCILVTNDEGEFKDDNGVVLPGGICTHVTYPRLKKVIEGYTTPKGKVVAGRGENLEFFETSFVPLPQSRNQLQSFVRYSASLLQLKAGCFTTVEQTLQWSLHTDGKKHLFVLFDDCAVEDALQRLESVTGPVVVYVFAYDSDDDSAEIFSKNPNVTVQEVPQPLLDLFFRIKE